MTKYIGLTIGPIYKTLANAKKTRELWAASYIFSYIMREIIKKFKDREFLTPYVDDETLENKKGVGLFYDRFIFESEEGDFDKLATEIDAVLSGINNSSYIKKYFQLYYCEIDSSETHNKVTKQINEYLNSLELQQKFIKKESESDNALKPLLEEYTKNSFLFADAFNPVPERMESLPEIGVKELNLKKRNRTIYDKVFKKLDKKESDITVEEKNEKEDLYKKIKREFSLSDNELKQYHKYVAIVHSDGDKMTDTVQELNDKNQFKDFSKRLMEFAEESHKKIEAYGGKTVFAGGDDLLFFAPVVNGEKVNIFSFIDSLSKDFDEKFKDFSPKPTVSFGVSITYHKYPLYEALETSRNLLKDKAKDDTKTGNKNAVACRLITHSGQFYECVFEKNKTGGYEEFIKLLKDNDLGVDKKEKDLDSKIFTSITHTLFSHQAVLNVIATDKKKLTNFFTNIFNEPIHVVKQGDKTELRQYLKDVIELTHEIFSSQRYEDEDKAKVLYSVLQLNKFIRE